MKTAYLAAAAVPAIIVGLTACDNKGEVSVQKAQAELAKVHAVVKEDVRQMREGLPKGAQVLGDLLQNEPDDSLPALQRAIHTARTKVADLGAAKGTFFSFANSSGVVVRSESDPDLLAGQSFIEAFPGLKAALNPEAGNVEVFGEMQALRGVRTGADTAWVIAHPITQKGSTLRGVFVTGWSYRAFAFHLEQQARASVTDATTAAKESKVPLLYVFVLEGKRAYGAPVTPDVNAEALEKLDLISKTASAPYSGQIEIAGRNFGLAATRTPELADGTAVAVLLSQY